jgi:thioesterase domain-containing protein
MNLALLARHLGDDRPFYGIQARGVDGLSAPFARIEHMAAAYLGELRKLCPRGPYYLSGYCGGGVVAFAMARMLRVQGEEVAFLGLIDTYLPGSVPTAPRLAWLNSGIDLARLAAHAKRGIARNVVAARQNTSIALRRAVRATVPLELRDVWLTHAFFAASARFVARPYAGRLTLFRATDVRPELLAVPELGWQGLARAGIDVLDVPGDHDTVTSEPNAPALAERFEAALRAAERSGR